MLLKNFLPRTLFALVLCSTLAVASVSTDGRLEPTEAQSATTIEMIDKLSKRHYRRLALDENLSQAYLKDYLASMDPARLYFYASDIAKFEKEQNKHHEHLKSGNLEPGFAIYRVYRERVTDRLNWVLEQLQDEEVKYDFEAKDYVTVERKDKPWPKDSAEADQLWDKRIRLGLLNLILTGDNDEAEARAILQRRYSNQLKRVTQQNSQDVYETLINAFAKQYDPHTSYFSPRTSENFNINMSLQLEGIGAVLKSEDEHTQVVRLVAGGPADRQGQLSPSDRITGIGQGADGEIVDVVGWRLDEVVDKIRGKKGTVVRLQVVSGEAQPKIVQIKRDTVSLEDQAAQKAVLQVSDGERMRRIGVIEIPAFYHDFEAYRRGDENFRSTTRDVARLLAELQQENVEGIILDLRNNGGGSLQEATMLTDLFIDQGPVVQIREANGRVSQHNRSRSRAMYRGPMVVMINRLSASASEIFAGAIQDYQRGIVVGSQSFGKGTVQLLSGLPEGALKLTESKFYRVSGESTQHRGIVPDIIMPVLINADEIGESAYENALPWDKIAPAKHGRYFDFSEMLPSLVSQHEQRAKVDPDIVHILDRKALADQVRSRTRVSLNKEQRLQEKADLELARMEAENRLRAAKGLKVFKDMDEYRSFDEEETAEAEAAAANPKAPIDVDGDAMLNEAGFILVDILDILNKKDNPRVANF